MYSWLGVWDLELGAEYCSGVTGLKVPLAVVSNSSGLSLPRPLLLAGTVFVQLDCGGNGPDGGKFCIVCECCIGGG